MEELLNFLNELENKANKYVSDAEENDTIHDDYVRYNEENAIIDTVFLVKRKIELLKKQNKL